MGAKLKKLKNTPASKKAASNGSVAGFSKSKKQARGPKAYIEDATVEQNGGDGADDDDEAVERALDAEEMAAAVLTESEDEEQGQSTSKQSKGKSRASDADLAFLLNMDKRAISRSRAEEARLKKAERKAQRSEVDGVHDAAADGDSDGASTDMEGASEGSISDSETRFTDFDSLNESFDSAASMSGEENNTSDSDLDDEEKAERAEKLHEGKLTARKRRQELQEAQDAQGSKKRRLPVRGETGTWKEEQLPDSDEEEVSDEESTAKGKKAKASRTLHTVKLSDARALAEQEEEAALKQEAGKSRRQVEPSSTILSGARFGLQAPYTIMLQKPKSTRIAAAREQIARLSTDIIGDPEVSLGLLRRLSVFAQPTISRPEHDSMAREKKLPTEIEVDEAIRGAALMSLTAVYIDILPGYRIRALTDKEKSEKVNQETARRREWEQGLVEVYRDHLQTCEQVVRSKTTISPVALRSMCMLLTRATHFNFRTNLIGSLVSQLSRRGWNGDSQQCAESLVEVLQRDLTGEASLEVVRLLNRMIKERNYQINAKVLNLLLHLRLKDELGAKRANTVRADADSDANGSTGKKFQSGKGKAKPKDVRKGQGQHLSKKQIKKIREVKEVEKEMKEAEAEIDKEERERNQTETLKLLFVLYFSILKAEAAPGPLLGAALEGLAKFAHRVNLDFFRDLLSVLREHVRSARAAGLTRNEDLLNQESDSEGGGEDDEEENVLTLEAEARRQDNLRKALLCLVTAFELLSGQGEALIIDLSDMVGHLYAVVLPLCNSPSLEEVPMDTSATSSRRRFQSSTHLLRTDADLLLRALDLCLLRPRLSELPSERSAAFARRLLVACLSCPATTALRLLGVVRVMIAKDSRLEALVDTEDRARNGKFDLGSDQLELGRPLAAGDVAWELHLLTRHVNEDVAAAAEGILTSRSG